MSNLTVSISIYNFPFALIPKHTLRYRRELLPSLGETATMVKVIVDVADIKIIFI